MKITDNYDMFITLLLDLNTQIGLTDNDKFVEITNCFDLTEEEFIIENNKLKHTCYNLNMSMFDINDRIRNYTESQFIELIKNMNKFKIKNDLEGLSGIFKGIIIYKQEQEMLEKLIKKYRYESVELVKQNYWQDCIITAWS